MLPISPFHYIGLKMDLLAFRNSTAVAPLPLRPLFLTVLREDMSTLSLCFQYSSVSHYSHKAALQLPPGVPEKGAHRGHKMIIAGHMNGLLHFIAILMCDIRHASKL